MSGTRTLVHKVKITESNRIHEQFLQVGALPVHPYDHPAAKQPSIGQMNRKVYQLEAIDVVARTKEPIASYTYATNATQLARITRRALAIISVAS